MFHFFQVFSLSFFLLSENDVLSTVSKRNVLSLLCTLFGLLRLFHRQRYQLTPILSQPMNSVFALRSWRASFPEVWKTLLQKVNFDCFAHLKFKSPHPLPNLFLCFLLLLFDHLWLHSWLHFKENVCLQPQVIAFQWLSLSLPPSLRI